MTLNDLIDRWLRDRQRHGCRPSTLRVYASRCRALAAALGERPLSQLARSELLDWIDAESHWPADHPDQSKRNQQKRPDTIRLVLTVVGMLQTFAVDRELLAEPLLKKNDLRKPKGRRRERLATPEETQRIVKAATLEFRLLYEALRRTGARPSELCGADIEQIVRDGARRTIVLEHHKTSNKDGSLRKIPISRGVSRFFDQAIGARESGPIFLTPSGRRWTREQVTSTFRKLRRRLGLPEQLVVYCCRHEFGSQATRKHGIFAASQLMGHSSVNTTQKYAHMQDEERHECQADLFDDVPDSGEPDGGEPDEPHEAGETDDGPVKPRDVVPLPEVSDPADAADVERGPAAAAGDPAGDRDTPLSGQEAA